MPNQEEKWDRMRALLTEQHWGLEQLVGITNIKNSIKVVQKLSQEHFNSFLVGKGAEKYAMQNGAEFKNMLSGRGSQYFYKK